MFEAQNWDLCRVTCSLIVSHLLLSNCKYTNNTLAVLLSPPFLAMVRETGVNPSMSTIWDKL